MVETQKQCEFTERNMWEGCRYLSTKSIEIRDTPGRSREFMTILLCKHPDEPQLGEFGTGGCKKNDCPYMDDPNVP